MIVELESLPFVSFALEQRGVPFVQVAVQNFSDCEIVGATLDLEIAPGLGDRQSFPLPTISPGEKGSLPIDYRLTPGRLRHVVEAERGQISWSVRHQGRVLSSEARPIDIQPFNHWPGGRGAPGLVAMFVTPNHPEIARILQRVRERLRGQTGDASLDGYQSRNADRVRLMVRTLYESIQSLGLTYAEPPPSFEDIGQKIRMPDVLVRDQMGCCLDISLLFVACLEQMGLNALLIVIDGHAFHGVWLVNDFFPELVVEDPSRLRNLVKMGHVLMLDSSTNVKTPACVFEVASTAAQAYLADDEEFRYGVDLKAARDAGFRPLPLRDGFAESTPATAVAEQPMQRPASPPIAPPASITTRPRPEPPPPAAASRFRKWQERLLDLTLRNRLLNLGRPGRGWFPVDVPDLALFEDILSTSQPIELLPRPAREAAAVFADRREDGAEVHQKLLSDLRRGTVYANASAAGLGAVAKRLERARRADLEEGGANSLYAAIGLLKWCEPGSNDFILAPLLLYPVELSSDRARGRLQIQRLPEEAVGNPSLYEKLRREHQVDLSPLVELEADDNGIDVGRLIQGVRTAIQRKAGWEVLDDACIGQFTFTKFLMWKDLEENAKVLCENPVVRHIAEKDSRFEPSGREVTPDELDAGFPPADLPCVLNADSTQMAAVATALSGRSFVLQGPPGTGKSQTITNLIAAAMARGKTVLFVSEKMAALEVVHRRLKEVGLEAFCLELHSNKSSKRDVLDSLASAFRREVWTDPVPWVERSLELADAREVLNSYAGAVNRKRPAGGSFYELQGQVLALAPEIDLGFAIAGVDTWTDERLRRTREIVADFASHASRVEPPGPHPWRVARQKEWTSELDESLRAALGRCLEQLDDVDRCAKALAGLLGVPAPATTAALRDLAAVAALRAGGPVVSAAFGPGFPAVVGRVSAYVAACRAHQARRTALEATWKPPFLAQDLSVLEARFGRWAGSFFLLAWIFLFRARKALRELARGKLPPNRQIAADLGSSRAEREGGARLESEGAQVAHLLGGVWSPTDGLEALEALIERAAQCHEPATRLGIAEPALTSALSAGGPAPSSLGTRAIELRDSLDELIASEGAIQRALLVEPGEGWPLRSDAAHRDGLRSAVERWQAAIGTFRAWCQFRRASAAVDGAGVSGLSQAYLSGKVPAARIGGAFERTLHSRLLAKLRDTDPVLGTFSGTSHHRLVGRFSSLDREIVELARSFVALQLEARLPRFGAAVAETSEPGQLAREIEKKKRHLPIRKLLSALPNLLPKLKPCFLMSPLSVAHYLPADGRRFDLVVFDEASQIGTHDAIGAIARGNQVIVVGDSKQLPPTSFFNRVADDDDALPDENDQEELESILDETVAKGLPQQMLGWHYRSRHDSLIEFSNRSYYNGRLHVFPAAARKLPDLGVSWHPVADGVYRGGSAEDNPRTNPREASVLVEHLVSSLRSHAPEKRTFGVVTFSMAQKVLIEELLDAARVRYPEIEPHFEGGEHVFVKNLENVQGDERDEILFSICYAKDERGKLRLHFGPLSNKGGERRLNVAITRARVQLRVFSTLTHDQIDLARTDSRGAADLKEFLSYASRSGAPDERALAAKSAHVTSHLERQIRDVLQGFGYQVHASVGTGGYRVDLAVVHPREAGQYLLGVECDGPHYASAKTARDRDRLRQQILEGLGWKLHRVWSADWVLERDVELARLRAALDGALAAGTATSAGAPSPKVAEDVKASVSRPPGKAAPESRLQSRTPEPAAVIRSAGPRAVAQAAPEPADPSRPYRAASPALVSTEADSLYWENSQARIQSAVLAVVTEEGPVHVDAVGRRVIGCFGLSKLTSKASARIGEVIDQMGGRRLIIKRGDFLWPATLEPSRYEGFRGRGEDGAPRDLQYVAAEEIANAAAWVLQQNLSLERSDLARETATLFGLSRLGKNVVAAIEGGISLLLERGLCKPEGTRIAWCGAPAPSTPAGRPSPERTARSPLVSAEVLKQVAAGGPLIYVVDQSAVKTRDWAPLRELLEAIEAAGQLFTAAGRLVLSFDGLDNSPVAVPEIPECREWLLGLERDVPFLFLALEPRESLQLLMLCHVPFKRNGGQLLLEQDQAMGFLLDCAYATYAIGRNHQQDARAAAVGFLTRVGLGHEINDELLGDFARTYQKEHR